MEIFQYEFMQNAFIVGIILAILSPILGVFLIIRRYTLISDTLAHTSLTGVIIWIILKISPIITTLFYSIFMSFLIEKLRQTKKMTWDMVLALILASNLWFVAIILSLNNKVMFNLSSYLFWSISLISRNDVYVIWSISFFIWLVFFLIKNNLMKTIYDEDSAIASWINTEFINNILILATGTIITLALPIIWILLIWTLIVLPVIIATQVSCSFKSTLIIAEIISVISVLSWIIISYYYWISASWMIIAFLIMFFVLFSIFNKLRWL